ncbi:MAG: transporter permease [Paenibacillus sp.]|jgi:peptide/nickel transport system permease protein|uniref:ABC transporter permease n=1 Tax=Paenibacillus hemerocallicola TaxID=1172614 RepID=A0A5C4T4H6_9BACL|nr:ABC transporter permease [Paenibacillus hemerocallicola]MDF2661343.1 transporter permease [Paenibacillus sp.]TNJ63217.1 ABC transporter permease [Paenibacillus hemerocallicola]
MRANKQLAAYIGVFVFVLLLNFWLPRLLPGGPVEFLTGGEEGAVFVSEAQKKAMLDYYHLDGSLWDQFTLYLQGLFSLDFGLSFSFKAPVVDIIAARLPWTVLIVGISTLLSLLIGLTAGLLSAWRHPGKTDRGLFLGMLSLSAVPEFLIGMLLLIVLAVNWSFFPLGGAETAFYRAEHWWDRAADVARHALLPVVTLTAGSLAGLYLLMRNEAIRVRGEPFVEFASAKGIGDRAVLLRHVARNAALPLVTIIVMRMGGLVAGSVLAETVFAYPGVGKLLQEAIHARDYPLLHGLFLMMTVVVLGLNAVADLIYPRLDPRIRTPNRGDPA